MPAETKVAERPTTVQDFLKTPKDTWQYVTIPDEDVTGKEHPSIWLNKIEFAKGTTYQVPGVIADYVKGRIKAFNRSVTRLFSPQVDREALGHVAMGTTAPSAPSGDRPAFVDATKVVTL
jgi:hypothetical protein